MDSTIQNQLSAVRRSRGISAAGDSVCSYQGGYPSVTAVLPDSVRDSEEVLALGRIAEHPGVTDAGDVWFPAFMERHPARMARTVAATTGWTGRWLCAGSRSG